MVYDLAYRRDHGSSTAQTAFCEFFYFIQINFSFLHFQTQISFCHMDQRTACDGRKDAVGFWCYNGIIFGYKEEVGTAGFLYFLSGGSVQIHVLVITILMRVYNGMQAHGIVQPCFNMTGSVRCGAVKIGDTDGQGLYSAFKVRSYGCCEYTELIFVRRLYTDDRIASEHVGADV